MKKTLICFLALSAFGAFAQTAEEIIKRMELNTVLSTSRAEGRLIITDRFGKRTSSFISWARGTKDTLIEFTSSREKGQKVLRTADEIYLYYPNAEELIRIQGSALRDSLLGSDVSYEDMTGGKGLLSDYEVVLEGTEVLDGRDTFRLRMTAKRPDVPYQVQVIWVDSKDYIYLRIDRYAKSGKLLKQMFVLDLVRTAGKVFPSHLRIVDVLKTNSSTEFIVDKIEIGIAIDPEIFSLENLTW